MNNGEEVELTAEEIAEKNRYEQYEDADKAVQSVLYRVLMFHIYSVDVYDHKKNIDLHELIGFRDNGNMWNPVNQKETDALVGVYREPMNIEFDKLHNNFNVAYVEIGSWLQFMEANQLYAIGKKIMAYDISKGFTEELSDIVGRKNLERVYRLAQ